MTKHDKTLDGMACSVSRGEYDVVDAITLAVDAKGRAMDEKWGVGRLPTLVPAEWAAKFAAQSRKFGEAIEAWSVADATKHGDAMQRAYDRLDELAVAGGHRPVPPEQWEFDIDGELVILIRDIRQVGLVERHGRKAQVWSLDEIASVVRQHPILAACKNEFPGAEIISDRVGRDVREHWREALDELPF